MSLSSLPGKEGVERTQYHKVSGELNTGATHGLALYQVWKVLIFLVLVLALLPHQPPVFRSPPVPRMSASFSSLAFSLRGEGRLPCHGVGVLGELSSYRMVKRALPTTLPFTYHPSIVLRT